METEKQRHCANCGSGPHYDRLLIDRSGLCQDCYESYIESALDEANLEIKKLRNVLKEVRTGLEIDVVWRPSVLLQNVCSALGTRKQNIKAAREAMR